MKQALDIVGRVEWVSLLDYGNQLIPAKVDTGADISSIWATMVKEQDHSLSFVLFGKKSEYYTGEKISLQQSDYNFTRIANSFGDKELRYVVNLRVRINGRIIKANFSLANRSRKTYPILLGRRLLKNKFLVDVAKGNPLLKIEKSKRENLRTEIEQDRL